MSGKCCTVIQLHLGNVKHIGLIGLQKELYLYCLCWVDLLASYGSIPGVAKVFDVVSV